MASAIDDVMKERPWEASAKDATTLQAMQAAKTQPSISPQKLGAAMATEQGKQGLEAMKVAGAETSAAQQRELATQKQQAQATLSNRELAMQSLAEKNTQKLFEAEQAVGSNLAQQKRQYVSDEQNRKYLNSQMLDAFAREQFTSEEQLQDYVAQKEMTMQRKAALLNSYAKSLEQVITQGYLREKGDLDQASMEKIARIQAEYKKREAAALKKAQEKSQLKGLIIQGVSTAAGAAATVYSSGNVWAGAGASAATSAVLTQTL